MTQKANDIPMVTMETACVPLPEPQPRSWLRYSQVSNIICIS
ncbi:MAG TPA: hypothetical protein VGC14_04570 [Rhizobium sp.]